MKVPQRHRIDLLDDIRRQRAQLDAYEAALLSAMAADPDPYPGDPFEDPEKEWVREEVACVLRVAPVTAGAKLHAATRLVERFPAMLEAMWRGDVPGYYATRLVDLTEELPAKAAAKVAERVLPRAAQQTVSQFSAAVRRAVLAVDPRSAEEKHQRARQDRRVYFGPPSAEGMCEQWALLPADQSAELRAKVYALADSWEGDGRTLDQRRADALCVLGGGTGTAPKAINVTVALSTLLGVDDQPAELDGEPVAAGIARALAFDPGSRWRRLLIDDGGRLVDVSSPTYRPPAPLQRFVELRDRTCQFPGCRRKAVYCEKDHVIRWSDGGPTSAANLHCLCKRHHILKHQTRWRLQRRPDGTTEWTTPTKHRYERPPPDPPPH